MVIFIIDILGHKIPHQLPTHQPLSAKVLANRMKKVLPHIISPNQSAFIYGRLITDDILVAFKVLHTMNGRMKGSEGYLALKLDMSKAYDWVE